MYDLLPWGLRIALRARAVRFFFLSNNLNLLYPSTLVTCIRDDRRVHHCADEQGNKQRRQRNGESNNPTGANLRPRVPLNGGEHTPDFETQTETCLRIHECAGKAVLCRVSEHIPACLSFFLGHGRGIWNCSRSHKYCANRLTWKDGMTPEKFEKDLSEFEHGEEDEILPKGGCVMKKVTLLREVNVPSCLHI